MLPLTQLTLDRLEARDVPSATISVVGSKLNIIGDHTAERIDITDDGRGNISVKITDGASVITGSGKGITKVAISTLGGDDVISYRYTNNLLLDQDLTIDTGDGHDRVYAELYQGVSSAKLNLDIDTGNGRDNAEVRLGSVNNANVNLDISLGADADQLAVIMLNGISGKSNVGMQIAGNNGADRVDLNLNGKIDSGSTLDIYASNVVGADDRLVVRYKGELDGKMNVTADKAAVNYGVQGHFTLQPTSEGTLTAKVITDRGTYVSSAIVTDHTGAPKVTVLDRLSRYLSQPIGMKVTKG